MISDQAGEEGSRLPRPKTNDGRNITRTERCDCRVKGDCLDQQVHLRGHFSCQSDWVCARVSHLHSDWWKWSNWLVGLPIFIPSQTPYERQVCSLDQWKPPILPSSTGIWHNFAQSRRLIWLVEIHLTPPCKKNQWKIAFTALLRGFRRLLLKIMRRLQWEGETSCYITQNWLNN